MWSETFPESFFLNQALLLYSERCVLNGSYIFCVTLKNSRIMNYLGQKGNGSFERRAFLIKMCLVIAA